VIFDWNHFPTLGGASVATDVIIREELENVRHIRKISRDHIRKLDSVS
jgi:hypothetical protein